MKMSNSKVKSKKSPAKKESIHEIPVVKTAKGRRPHTETQIGSQAEPYQPSLLADQELEHSAVHEESNPLETQDATSETHEPEEVLLKGQPAPDAEARKTADLLSSIENVKEVVQMGTAMVRSSFPKPFEIAEKVVENWKQDGDFSELPIDQPLVQFYVGLGLRKAKQTEKELEQRLETTGVLPVVRQQWIKAQKLFK